MSSHTIDRFELEEGVPAVVLVPKDAREPRTACLFLYGGGGSAELLATIAPLLDGVPSVVACAGVPPFCFYLDRWERVIADALRIAIEERFAPSALGLVGISMGGYGALRIAFERPSLFRAVAAVAPMIEPALDARTTRPRNRFHYPDDVPSSLREAETPAARARRNATQLRDLAILLDAGSRDALNAHDGAEHLHRCLWELDVAHEYHLHRDADHVGRTIAPRLRRAFDWVAAHLASPKGDELSSEERDLRAMIAPARAEALAADPTTKRLYGPIDP